MPLLWLHLPTTSMSVNASSYLYSPSNITVDNDVKGISENLFSSKLLLTEQKAEFKIHKPILSERVPRVN